MTDNKTNVLNRVFTRNTLRQWIGLKAENTYVSVVKRYTEDPEKKKNAELISEIYSELKKNYRNEYFYKNTLLNKLLLGVHSVNTTTALTEIPVAKSKADFVLINGKAVVYEIKTELDNFERLESQLNDYYKSFNYVAVVTYKENLKALMKKMELVQKPIGIYVLQKSGRLSTVRKPEEYNNSLDANIMFKILRKPEYEAILLKQYGETPNVSQFRYYTECKKMFLNIPISKAHSYVIEQLKKRNKIVKEDFVKVPYELKFLAYFMELKSEDYSRLNIFLEQQFEGG
ncbi:MAG: sce7726 family protein [Dethiosulfatibacter sp.]|nr:sce7726 family protein [Dethiosulfatibacter sp.]